MRFPTIENFTSVVPSTGLPNVYLQKKKIPEHNINIISFIQLISMMCDSTSGCKQIRKGLGYRWKWKGVRVAKIEFDRFKQVNMHT